jgi:hypothetical protein
LEEQQGTRSRLKSKFSVKVWVVWILRPTRKSLTIKDFYRDFGVVALDVDDLYFNWVNKTARGKGELEFLGQTIANTDFSMNSSSLTIKDFDVDLGVVALDVDDLSVN